MSGSDDWGVKVSVRLPEKQVERIDQSVEAGHYLSRSAAIRAAIEVQHARLFKRGRGRAPRGGQRMSRPAGSTTRSQEGSPTAYGGRCEACDRMVWVLASDETRNWCDARCGRCGQIIRAAKDGELGRQTAAEVVRNEAFFVDRAREGVVGFEGVPGDE